MKEVTILVNARNEEGGIGQCLESLVNQDYEKSSYEILVIDDASSDGTGDITKHFARKYGNIIYKRFEKRQGRVRCVNLALGMIKTPYFIEFNADCIAECEWLKKMMKGFRGKDVGISKAIRSGIGDGISTAFRTDIVKKMGGADERYNELGASFRYDTDMIFSIKEMNYKIVFVDARYGHLQKKPVNLRQKVKYALYRIKIHKFDALLYKKHPKLAKDFLKIKYGFMRSPMEDFRVASGLWTGEGEVRLSSPQGVTILEEKTHVHFLLIITLALFYTFSVKISRLYGSLIYKKLII